MATQRQLTQGMKVRSADGETLGKIIEVTADGFIVEKGFFFLKDYAVPMSMLREVRDGEAWLMATKEQLEKGDLLYGGAPAGAEARAWTETSAEGPAPVAAEGEQRMTLSEEELEARKRVRDAGEVTIRKVVTTEHKQIDVPVTKEEVRVERAPAVPGTPPRGDAFQEETIRVPIHEEEIEVTKRPRVREEVRVVKEAYQEERRVEGEVRHEEARIEAEGKERRKGEPDEPE